MAPSAPLDDQCLWASRPQSPTMGAGPAPQEVLALAEAKEGNTTWAQPHRPSPWAPHSSGVEGRWSWAPPHSCRSPAGPFPGLPAPAEPGRWGQQCSPSPSLDTACYRKENQFSLLTQQSAPCRAGLPGHRTVTSLRFVTHTRRSHPGDSGRRALWPWLGVGPQPKQGEEGPRTAWQGHCCVQVEEGLAWRPGPEEGLTGRG